MFALTFLNVGHGLSVLAECHNQDLTSYGIIDCNLGGRATPKALDYLRTKQVTTLSFVALTHPHADHFTGLYSLLEAFAIKEFYSFALGNLLQNEARFKKYQKQLAKLLERSSDQSQRAERLELMKIFRWARDKAIAGNIEWKECDGEENILAPQGFAGVNVATIAPPKRSKGNWITKIDLGEFDSPENLDLNDLSLAFKFEYLGKTIVVGADATKVSWDARRKFDQKRNHEIRANVLCLPHHGSNKDSDEDTINLIMGDQRPAAAVASANGRSHPHADVIRGLARKNILPYCTNLIQICGANIVDLAINPTIDRELARWIAEVSTESRRVQVCQGDIRVEISDTGNLTVQPETGIPCPFRGDWERLFS